MADALARTTPATIADSAVRPREVLPGALLGQRYRLGLKIAEGGMGCIYHATDLCSQRPVAVKLLRPEVATCPEIRQRFLNEARATMSIAHEGVIQIIDLGELPDGSTFYVMELLDGKPLDEHRALDLPAIVSVALQLCDGLTAAHDKGVIHRDLKPENVMVRALADGSLQCKLIDFGVAKVTFIGSLTLPGQVMGTPAYLAPEQARATGGVDARTDIYSLGVVLYELIARRLPFVCEDLLQLLLAHQFEAPPELTGCPPELAAVVMRCLKKDPNERFASLREVAAALRAVSLAEPAPPPSVLSDSSRTTVYARPSLPPPARTSAPPPIAWPRPPAQAWPPAWLVPVLVLTVLVMSIGLAFSVLAG